MSARIRLCPGVTLVEMAIAAALTAMIGLSLFAVFHNGLKIWEKVTARMPEEAIFMFLETFASDIRNTFPYESVEFRGDASSVKFPAVVASVDLPRSVGRIEYAFDGYENVLIKRQFDASGVYHDRPSSVRKVLRRVEQVAFAYYMRLPSGSYVWTNVWPRDKFILSEISEENKEEPLPLAVRVDVGVRNGKSVRTFTRTVFLPTACCLAENIQ